MGKIILTIITIVIGGSAAGALEHKSISAKDKEFLAGQNVPRVSAPAREKGILDLPVNNSGNTSSHRNTNSAAGINPQAAKDWTVLVYLNGKNDLERGELYSLNS
ncbi:MAG: hypothetical protein NTY45_08410, partial [Elusimicrobia bacterium]|nr:hypothetical protein [Elusimicrobiota bacterium]